MIQNTKELRTKHRFRSYAWCKIEEYGNVKSTKYYTHRLNSIKQVMKANSTYSYIILGKREYNISKHEKFIQGYVYYTDIWHNNYRKYGMTMSIV